MRNTVITDGQTFVYFGPPTPSREELARKWLNYGFNEYVTNRGQKSYVDFIRYDVESKADDERGRWIKAWYLYGFELAILYFEVLKKNPEYRYNAYRTDKEFLDLVHLDYSVSPPTFDSEYSRADFDYYSVIRVPNENGNYSFLYSKTSNEPLSLFDVLEKYGHPMDFEIVNILFWTAKRKKGVKN